MEQEKQPGRRAFVTGATGAVGASLTRRLLEKGWHVTAFHRGRTDTTELRSLGADLVEGELTAADGVIGKVPDGTDAFFHVAADLSLWSRHNERQMAVNVGGTRNAVEAALRAGVRRFILTSTISAYGRQPGPIHEDSPSVAAESFICYERSKWLAEEEVRKGMARGLDAVIINPCAIMGPGFRQGWAFLFRQIRDGELKVLPPGSVVVNHMHEVVEAHIAAYERGRSGHNYILTGSATTFAALIREAGEIMGIPVTAKVMKPLPLRLFAAAADLASKVTGREPALTPELAALMAQDLALATDKACRELGYREIPWQECVKDMYDWLHTRGGI